MEELQARLAELEAKLTAFRGRVGAELAAIRGEIELADQGPLSILDRVAAEVETNRAFLLAQFARVEARVAALRPD